MKRILLISNSTVYGRGYFDHVADEIRNFWKHYVNLIPPSLHDRDSYAAKAKTRFAELGYALESAHDAENPRMAVEEANAIFIGGGNTFRLLKALQDLELLEVIRRKVLNGTPYIGSSVQGRMSPDPPLRPPPTICPSSNRSPSTR